MTLAWILGAVAGMTLHEWAHARAAWHAGDATPLLCGRMSLNPLRHVAWYGLKPISLLKGAPWWVYAAGPAANVAVAGLAAVVALGWPPAAPAAHANLLLAAFNLVPIKPLDGWAILKALHGER